jgi:hypothetical protein
MPSDQLIIADTWEEVDGEMLGILQHGEPVGDVSAVLNYRGAWAACDACHEMIVVEDWLALRQRAGLSVGAEGLQRVTSVSMQIGMFKWHRTGTFAPLGE